MFVYSPYYSRSLFLSPVNVNHVNRSFLAAAQQEKRLEREALESGLMFSRDRLNEATAVRTGRVL